MSKSNFSRDRQRGAALLWIILLIVFLGAIAGGALIGYWVFQNIDLRMVLKNQPAMVTIDEPLTVTGRVLDKLDIRIDDVIRTQVPVDQRIKVPVKETLTVIADFDGTVPIKMDVKVRDKIVIDQVLDLNAVIDAEILGDKLKLPIRGKVPVKATVPVSLDIPVNQPVHLKFTAPVGVRIKQDLDVPLKTVIDAAIPIQADLSVPVKSDLRAEVEFGKDPTAVTIVDANLRLPLRTLRLEVKDEAGKPAASQTTPAEPNSPP